MAANPGTTNQQSNLGGRHPIVEKVLTHTSTSSTTHNIAMPSEVNAGEMLLVMAVTNDDFEINAPAGWTEIFFDSSPNDMAINLSAKIANGTEGGTSPNFPTTDPTIMAAQIFRISAWSGSLVNISWNYSDDTFAPGEEVVPWGSYENIWINFFLSSMSGTYSAHPAGYSDFVEIKTGTTINDAQVYSCRLLNVASSMDPGSWIFSSPVGTWYSAHIVIKGATVV